MATRTILTLLLLALASPVSAQTIHRRVSAETLHRPVAYGPDYADGDGFAGPFVRGDYIGEPLTRVPRPSEIVPAPWSYGTYGIPTVTGIAPPPAAEPTLTVINAGTSRGRLQESAGEAGRTAGARIIAVQVPRR